MQAPTSLEVRVLLFASLCEAAGSSSVCVVVPASSSVAHLRKAIAVAVPALAPLLPACRVAVGLEFVKDEEARLLLSAEEEVAVIPPVSGG